MRRCEIDGRRPVAVRMLAAMIKDGTDFDVACWGSEVTVEQVLGAPCRSFVHRHRQLAELLTDAHRFPEREYLVQGVRRINFREHERAVSRTSELLLSLGIRPGAPVLLLGANSIEWVVSFWAILRIGGVVVLGNAWWSELEIAHAVTITEPALVIADVRRGSLVPAHQWIVNFESLNERSSDGRGDGQILTGSDNVEDHPAVIVFTSGTTGMPKGAVLSHRGIIAALQSLLERTKRLPTPDSPAPTPTKALLSLPLFHIGGLLQILTPMVSGGSIVFSDGRFRPELIMDLIRGEDIKVWSTVPTMVSRLMDHMEDGGHPALSGVRTVGLGGAPVADELRERVLTHFPNAARGLAVTYGLSEAGGVVATGAGAEMRLRPGTVGRPLITSEVRIVEPDETGTGEIAVRSPSVMLGYWREPSARVDSAAWDAGPVTAERWLSTGDIGRMDEDGYLYISDRSKDIVIRGGENIATPHVEGRIAAHHSVQEVAVLGLPHPTLGEELAAVVVLRPGASVTPEDLAQFSAQTLAYFEVPTKWRFLGGTLPKNVTGKVMKREIRNDWLASLADQSSVV